MNYKYVIPARVFILLSPFKFYLWLLTAPMYATFIISL